MIFSNAFELRPLLAKVSKGRCHKRSEVTEGRSCIL